MNLDSKFPPKNVLLICGLSWRFFYMRLNSTKRVTAIRENKSREDVRAGS